MNNIKPCPCCGPKGKSDTGYNKELNAYRAGCYVCGLVTKWYDTQDEAISAWNSRPGEHALVDALKTFLADKETEAARDSINFPNQTQYGRFWTEQIAEAKTLLSRFGEGGGE